jgi:hypothetical protein
MRDVVPVMQTALGRSGNCLAACIASLLEVPLASVPDSGKANWWDDMRTWFRTTSGYELIPMAPLIAGWPLSRQQWAPPGYAIATVTKIGPTKIPHAVVTLSGRIIHDPEVSTYPDPDPLIHLWYVPVATKVTFDAWRTLKGVTP